MKRREFIISTAMVSGGFAISGIPEFSSASIFSSHETPWFDKAMRWAQLAFVENDPGNYDPDFWLDYFKKTHVDGVLLSAGGIVAFYPTEIPYHHKSDWMGNSDPLGYLVKECRKMGMSIILRTDSHAARQDMYDAHPDYIAVTNDGQKRQHWARKDLWVTCALGPYNFDFMTNVHKEIMQRYQPEGIFTNRWSGHGICYCEHCKKNFKEVSGSELPINAERLDPVYQKWSDWNKDRLKELWFLWDAEIRKIKPTSRFIPNGFPDKLLTGKHSDFFFADRQARSGVIPPWTNAIGAKELRPSLGMKPIVGIFSVGFEVEHRWKDSVQSDAEIRIWVAEGVANGMKPCFVKFGGNIFDKRWMNAVADMYQKYYKCERYLRNTAPMARIGMVFSEQTSQRYGGKPWQNRNNEHALGMYHALIEGSMPFEMVNDKLLDEENLKAFKLLILPNIAALSDKQCDQLRRYVASGGSIVATFETSLYDEEGKPRRDFALKDIFGVSYDNDVEGPMKNSYLRLKKDEAANAYHPVLDGLEDAYRTINTIYQVKVKPDADFPSPVTLIPTYPDLPMEDVYPREKESGIRELYLREKGNSRIAYIPGDMDRSFWQIMSADHSKLLRNTILWALNEKPIVNVQARGIVDVAVWRQKESMTIHLVNLTNPMMMKGPFRELFPVDVAVKIEIPENKRVTGVHLLLRDTKPTFEIKGNIVSLNVTDIPDHEIIALDLS